VPTRVLSLVLAAAVFVTGCSATDAGPADDPTATAPGGTTSPSVATSTPMPTTAPVPPTTEAPLRTVAVGGDVPDGLAGLLSIAYSRMVDDRNHPQGLAGGLVAYLDSLDVAVAAEAEASMVTAGMPSGETVAVVHIGDDIAFAVEHSDGWELVGMAPAGRPPWLFDEPGLLLVIGSDARPGQLQTGFRADSIHVLALSPTVGGGTIVGFPRDTYISAELIGEANAIVGLSEEDLPSGSIKWTSLMAGRGPEIMLETARGLTGLPIEGYIVSGFLGFDALITELGGLQIDLPSEMRSGNNWENFPAGEQLLNPTRALQLARIRKGLRGGDFARSLNQGLIMLAAMEMVQERGIDALPALVQVLAENTFTDLDAGRLLAFSAAGLLLEPGSLGNLVVPGEVEIINTRSVVLIDEPELARIAADVADDGIMSG
jgi:LCP family protein required for cell wall assembly